MKEIRFPKPKLHLFVCINDRSKHSGNTKPSCGPRITAEDVKEIKLWLQAQGLTTQVYCTKAQCLGFCTEEGSVVALYPQGRFFIVQNKNEIKDLIQKEI